MKKFFLFICAMLLFQLQVLAQPAWNNLKIGNEYVIRSGELLVRQNNPNENISCRPLARLPKQTKVKIIYTETDWSYIEWYSNTSKIYKKGWAPTVKILIYSGEPPAEASNNAMIRFLGLTTEATYTKQAKTALSMNNYESACDYATKALNAFLILSESSKESTDYICSTYFLKGTAHAMNKEYLKAIDCFNEALFYNKDFKAVYYLRGLSYWEAGYYSKAKQDLLTAKNVFLEEGNQKKVIEVNKYIQELDRLINLAK